VVPKIAIPVPPISRLRDPAKDAARLLGWFGLTILMVGAPLVGVLSRRSLFVLLPIGASLLCAAFFISVSTDGLKALREALRQPVGLAALFLGGWMGLSLIWTPFPSEALGRYASTLVTSLVAALIIAHLPERRARPALYLLPGGMAVTALLTLGMALLGPPSFRGGTEFDPSLLERSVLTLVVMVWPALGALCAFGRWTWAMALAALVAAAVTFAAAPIAMAVFALGALTFAAAVTHARRTAAIAAFIVAGLIVVAPALPFALAPLAHAIPMVGRSTVAAMADWRDLVKEDGVRLVTGHGLDMARHGAATGFLPPHTPRSILFEAWYDLGILGALALAAVFAVGLLAAERAASFVAPALLAGMVATLAIALFGVATAQLWFVTLASLQAVAFGLLCRSSRGGDRPTAAALELADRQRGELPDTPVTSLRM
jgi:hypothetical protein